MHTNMHNSAHTSPEPQLPCQCFSLPHLSTKGAHALTVTFPGGRKEECKESRKGEIKRKEEKRNVKKGERREE